MNSIYEKNYLEISNIPHSTGGLYRVKILRDATVEPIGDYLRYVGFTLNLNVDVSFSGYETIVQEAHAIKSFSSEGQHPDCIIIMKSLRSLAPDLVDSFPSLSQHDIEEAISHAEKTIDFIVTGIKQEENIVCLWCAFEYPAYPALGITDSSINGHQVKAIDKINDYLAKALKREKAGYVVDVPGCVFRVGYRNFYDMRNWYLSRCPYTLEAFREMGVEIGKLLRSVVGMSKKCLVLDCDNTLWGGVIGEDGLDGIILGDDSAGAPYKDLQRCVVGLYERGVIVALCSKNEEGDVWNVFDNHPDMLLKKEHISCHRINWKDKADNILDLSKSLNIGVDSIVFVDDNTFETSLVKKVIPEVEVVELNRETLIDFHNKIYQTGWFDSILVSEEDKSRGKMYAEEEIRKTESQRFVDVDAYLRSLAMTVTIRLDKDVPVSRASQLTQRTNQFNLTTKRYTEIEIANFANSDDFDIISIRLDDNFGSLGVIGLAIIEYKKNEAWLDTFLLSCRAIGRHVEDVLFSFCLRRIKDRNITQLHALYVPTAKNKIVSGFMDSHGFVVDDLPSGKKKGLLSIEEGCSMDFSDVFARVLLE